MGIREHVLAVRRKLAELPKLEATGRVGDFPLSINQERMHVILGQAPRAPFGKTIFYELRGRLDRGALERALTRVFANQDMLRTTFPFVGDTRVARVAPPAPITLDVVQGNPREVAANAPVFDLGCDVPLRLTLVQHDAMHTLVAHTHFAIFDATSMEIFTSQLVAQYNAELRGEAGIEPPAFQIQDLAAWQKKWFVGERREEYLSFWRTHMRGGPPKLHFADARKAGLGDPTRRLAQERVAASTASRIWELARTLDATEFTMVAAVFAMVIRLECDVEDVVLGTFVANRTSDTRNVIGQLASIVPLRLAVRRDDTFVALLNQTGDVLSSITAHAHVPSDSVLPGFGVASWPLYAITINFFVMDDRAIVMDGMESVTRRAEAAAFFDLEVYGGKHDALELTSVYNPSVYEEAFSRRLLHRYGRLVGEVAADHARTVGALLDAATH